MAKVHNNDMVAHVWAQQTESEGRNANNTFYFVGATIYSYGLHFPVARVVTHKKHKAVLITADSYSITTSAHISKVHRACLGLTVFKVGQVVDIKNGIHKSNLKDYKSKISELIKLASKARQNKTFILSHVSETIKEANNYAAFFGLKTRIEKPENYDKLLQEAGEKEKKRKAKEALTRKQDIAKWRSFEKHRLRLNTGNYLLRLNKDKSVIETSDGANVPVDDAIKVWPLIKRCRSRNTEWVPNGGRISIGHFSVSKIEVTGNMRIRCHYIRFSEIEAIAEQLNLKGK